MFIIWVKTLRISLPLSNMIVGWIKYFNERKVLGIKGFCGTHGGSISIITFLLFNWGWSDKDDWKAKWRLKDKMTEGRNDDWRAKWRLKDEMTTEGRWRVRYPIQTDEWRIVFRTREKWALSDWLSAFSISLGMKIYFAPLRCVNLSGYIGVIVNNRPKWAETHYLVLC